MPEKLTIERRLQFSFGLTMALLLACAAIGVVGLNMLYNKARYVVQHDVQLAQHASSIEIGVLNERRFEKDAFINLADADKRESYAAKWEATRASLLKEIAVMRGFELEGADAATLGQLEQGFNSYAAGFDETLKGIRAGELKSTQDANGKFAAYKDAVHAVENAGEALRKSALDRVNESTA